MGAQARWLRQRWPIRCQLEVTNRLDSYPDRVAGEVGDRHLVHLHDLDAVRPGARGDRLAGGFALGHRQDLLPGRGAEREDPVDLAADLRDRSADRVGDGVVAGTVHLAGTGSLSGI